MLHPSSMKIHFVPISSVIADFPNELWHSEILWGSMFMYLQLQVLCGNSYYTAPPLTQCFRYAYATAYQRCIFLTWISGIAIIIAHAVLIIRIYGMN